MFHSCGKIEILTSRSSVREPTIAIIFFDRKENEAKETLFITVA